MAAAVDRSPPDPPTLLEGLASTRTIRRYTAEPIPDADLATIMWHYVDHIEDVPVIVLACLQRYREPGPSEGASVYPACQNLLLAARALGYGGALTMWHHAVEAELRELLRIPDAVALSACITLGRPVGHHGPVRRAPIGEVVFDDAWGRSAAWVSDPPGTAFTRWSDPRV